MGGMGRGEAVVGGLSFSPGTVRLVGGEGKTVRH